MSNSLINDLFAIAEQLKYPRKSIARCNQESQAAMEAENLAIDEFAAEIKQLLEKRDDQPVGLSCKDAFKKWATDALPDESLMVFYETAWEAWKAAWEASCKN